MKTPDLARLAEIAADWPVALCGANFNVCGYVHVCAASQGHAGSHSAMFEGHRIVDPWHEKPFRYQPAKDPGMRKAPIPTRFYLAGSCDPMGALVLTLAAINNEDKARVLLDWLLSHSAPFFAYRITSNVHAVPMPWLCLDDARKAKAMALLDAFERAHSAVYESAWPYTESAPIDPPISPYRAWRALHATWTPPEGAPDWAEWLPRGRKRYT